MAKHISSSPPYWKQIVVGLILGSLSVLPMVIHEMIDKSEFLSPKFIVAVNIVGLLGAFTMFVSGARLWCHLGAQSLLTNIYGQASQKNARLVLILAENPIYNWFFGFDRKAILLADALTFQNYVNRKEREGSASPDNLVMDPQEKPNA